MSSLLFLCCMLSAPTGAIAPYSTVLIASTVPAKPNQTLTKALITIGAPIEDVMEFQSTGMTTPTIIQIFSKYSVNSNQSMFVNLSTIDRGSLVLFGYALLAQNQISPEAIKTLMAAEKQRAGVSEKEQKALSNLVQEISSDPSFPLTDQVVQFVRSLLPAIDQNPFAFADAIGPLIQLFITSEENPSYPIDDEDIEQTLTQAAKTVSQLTDDQVANITQITQNYAVGQEFTPSQTNIDDIDDAMAVSLLPLGIYALYPLIGSEGVTNVNTITRSYPTHFNNNRVDYYQGQLARQTNPVANKQRSINPQANRSQQVRSLDRSRGTPAASPRNVERGGPKNGNRANRGDRSGRGGGRGGRR